MSRHQRLRRSLRSPVRHGKAGGNRAARQYRQDTAYLAACDAGRLPGELIPYRSRSGEILWMDAPPLTEAHAGYLRVRTGELRSLLAGRGLVPRREHA